MGGWVVWVGSVDGYLNGLGMGRIGRWVKISGWVDAVGLDKISGWLNGLRVDGISECEWDVS